MHFKVDVNETFIAETWMLLGFENQEKQISEH